MEEGFNIRGQPWIATERDVGLNWGLRGIGVLFRCAWCGHRFAVGDVVRCVFTNGQDEAMRGIGGNPLVCARCDCPRDELLAKLQEMRRQVSTKYWWFTR